MGVLGFEVVEVGDRVEPRAEFTPADITLDTNLSPMWQSGLLVSGSSKYFNIFAPLAWGYQDRHSATSR